MKALPPKMFFESDLLNTEVERYSRQVIVPGIHTKGQKKLRNARVLVVGCGGLGSPAIMYLSSCGIGGIGLVDFDRVEDHNLQRQVIYSEDDVAECKVMVAANFSRRMNSFMKITAYNEFLDENNVERILEPYSVILDCTDSIKTRYLLNDYCKAMKKNLICGSVLRWEGQLHKITPDGPCYRCLFPDIKSKTLSCEDGGVIGPICGIIGSLQASEAIKLIVGDNEPKMIIYDGITNKFTNIKLRNSKKSCEACNRKFMQSRPVSEPKCARKAEAPELERDIDACTVSWAEVLEDFDSYFFIDIRSPIQHEMFRVKGSKNIPLSSLSQELEFIKTVGKRIGIVCKRGISAKKGTQLLRNNGIIAFSINGGIDEFKSCLRKIDSN